MRELWQMVVLPILSILRRIQYALSGTHGPGKPPRM